MLLLAAAPWSAATESTLDDIAKASAEVEKEVRAWKPGQEVPHRLLSWPAGKVDPPERAMCGLAALGISVLPRIYAIDNEKLLEEIVFDPRAESESLHGAVVRLIDLKGLPWFARELFGRDETRWEHGVFRQLLQTSYAKTSVAEIDRDAMPEDEARRALEEIKSRLDKGQVWLTAYGEVSQAHPDLKDRKRDPQSVRVLIGFMYTGWVSAAGFDFSNLQSVQHVPRDVLAQGVRAGKGGTIVQARDGLYLVYVFETYSPANGSAAPRPIAARSSE